MPEPRAPSLAGEGSLDTRAAFVWSNTANREKGFYVVDAETRMLHLEGTYGISDTIQLEANLPVTYSGGGFTDHALDEYHQILGLPRGPRGRLPYDDYSIFGATEDGDEFELEASGTDPGDLTLGTAMLLTGDTATLLPVSLSLEVSLPTSTADTAQDGVDFTASLSAGSLHFAPCKLFAGGGVTVLTDRSERGVDFPSTILAGYLGADFPLWSESLSAALTALVTSELVENVARYAEYGVYFDAGIRYRPGTRATYEFLVRENPGPDNGTTDVSFLFGVSYRFFH